MREYSTKGETPGIVPVSYPSAYPLSGEATNRTDPRTRPYRAGGQESSGLKKVLGISRGRCYTSSRSTRYFSFSRRELLFLEGTDSSACEKRMTARVQSLCMRAVLFFEQRPRRDPGSRAQPGFEKQNASHVPKSTRPNSAAQEKANRERLLKAAPRKTPLSHER